MITQYSKDYAIWFYKATAFLQFRIQAKLPKMYSKLVNKINAISTIYSVMENQ